MKVVVMTDRLTFEPEQIEVAVGEEVTGAWLTFSPDKHRSGQLLARVKTQRARNGD